MSPIVIGIDISKKKFDVAFTINEKWHHETFENTLEGFQIFLNFLKDRNIESCHGVIGSHRPMWRRLSKSLVYFWI